MRMLGKKFGMIVGAITVALSVSGGAYGQSGQCRIPGRLPAAQIEQAPPGATKISPITGYTLALSWSPQFCRTHARDNSDQQCSQSARFGFILHGLWPEGDGGAPPAWCAPATPLPADLVRAHFCMTPSVKLQQHEWSKHGTCATSDPARYFRAASILYSALTFPDMDKISRSRPTAGAFKTAFVAANKGLTPDMVQIQTSRGDWLEEVRVCLDRDYRPRRCGRGRDAAAQSALKIWRLEK